MDALGRLIRTIEKRVDASTVPEDQIVVVFTDGHENSSTEWTREDLFRVITEKENDGWTVSFMGANQDAYDTSRGLGIKHENIQNFKNDGQGTRTAMDAVDKSLLSYRQAVPSQKLRRKSDFFLRMHLVPQLFCATFGTLPSMRSFPQIPKVNLKNYFPF